MRQFKESDIVVNMYINDIPFHYVDKVYFVGINNDIDIIWLSDNKSYPESYFRIAAPHEIEMYNEWGPHELFSIKYDAESILERLDKLSKKYV